jgi:y4mF family transcriptional regulator
MLPSGIKAMNKKPRDGTIDAALRKVGVSPLAGTLDEIAAQATGLPTRPKTLSDAAAALDELHPSLAQTAGKIAAQPRNPIAAAADLGPLIRAARRKLKLSQQAFADLAGVGRRFLGELEAGKPSLEFDKVMKVCAAAGIDILAAPRA